MRKDIMKFEVDWKGEIIDCEWIESSNFESLKNVKQVSAFVFDDAGRVCIIHLGNKGYWTIPGGGSEENETYEETLKREAMEEADIVIGDLIPIGYLKNAPRKNPENISHQLRYAAKVKEIKPQTEDPANGVIPTRKFVNKEEFLDYLKWDSTKEQLETAFNVIKTYIDKYK
jgi:8-oxo-dGTP diphosphatase